MAFHYRDADADVVLRDIKEAVLKFEKKKFLDRPYKKPSWRPPNDPMEMARKRIQERARVL